jgi:hypothetical protein
MKITFVAKHKWLKPTNNKQKENADHIEMLLVFAKGVNASCAFCV